LNDITGAQENGRKDLKKVRWLTAYPALKNGRRASHFEVL
jgi:hypothetical protein